MKLSRLFVLSALGLVSLSANAANLMERTAPDAPADAPKFGETASVEDIVKTPATFEAGKMYVIYNVEEQTYFSQGCAWATQASTSATPIVVRLTVPEGKTLADAALLFTDYNRYTNSWKEVFFDSETAMYTDRGNQAVSYFQVVSQGSNVYRLQASPANENFNPTNYPGFIGRDVAVTYDGDSNGRDVGTSDAQPLTPFLAEGDGHYLDWQFFDVSDLFGDWNDYFTALEVYNKSLKLKAIIEKADEAGIDVSDAEAVYNDEAATVEQMDAAIKALSEAMASGIEGSAANPGDATTLIINPDFDNASNDGWEGSKPNMVGSGSHGPANVAEVYNNTFDTYQDLNGMPVGVYGLSAFTTFRGSWEDMKNGTESAAKLYATADGVTTEHAFDNMWSAMNTASMAGATEFGTNAAERSQKDEETGITYYTPNDPSAARLYFEKGYYYNSLVFDAANGGARIGVKNAAKCSDGCDNWSIFDTFRLTYYGNEGAASYKAWLADNAAKLYATEATVTQSYVDAFQSFVNGLTAADAAAANAAYASAKESQALTDLKLNITLWGQWEAALGDAQKYTEGEYANLMAAADLGDYISEAEFMQDLSNDQLKAEIQKIADMVEAVLDELKNNVTPGTDVTDIYLVNANFNNGNQGWTDHVTDSRPGIAFSQNICEAYDTNFDMYQEVNNPQVGVYELQLQGFFRMGRDDASYTAYQNGEQKTTAGVYINTNKTYLKCIFDDGLEVGSDDEAAKTGGWMNEYDGKVYPNDMTSAAYAFGLQDDEGNGKYYVNKAYGLVAEAGETMRLGVGGDIRGANWICWDNFKLIYKGYDAEVIAPILEDAVASIDLSQPMGKSVYTQAKAAIDAAGSATDGMSMFKALKAIFAVRSDVEESVAIFAELTKAREALVELMGTSENEDAINEVGPFAENLENDINDHKYDNEDVPGLLNQIKVYRTKLRLPADYAQASDQNPIDMPIIDTPTFDNGEGGNSVEGWEAAGYNFGNDETQRSALLLEFYNKAFDLNQTIYGVPNGYYVVRVSSFARLDEAKTNPVYLYGVSDNNEFKAELADLNGEDGVGDMVSASAAFDEGKYINELVVKVTDETLRIGIKKETNDVSTTDWVIMDNWFLTYYKDSKPKIAEEIKGDVNGDGSVDVADISAIISQMAGTATYAAADVNGDGSVDVADISNVITIMAEMARLAKNAIEE